MHRVLFITYVKNYDATTQLEGLVDFLAEVNAAGKDLAVEYCTIQELVFLQRRGSCQILYKGKDIKDEYETLVLRNFHCFTDYANAIRLYAQHNHVSLLNPKDLNFPYIGKVSQGFLFAYNDIPTPDFISTMNNELLVDAITDSAELKFPLIVKHNDGVKGLHNFLVHSVAETSKVLQDQKPGFLAQPFIENDGELRVLTFPGREPLVFSKRNSGDGHLNNTARGGTGELVPLVAVEPKVLAAAHKIQQVTGRELGGIDVLLANDGRWFVLEVNHTPALSSGMFPAEKAKALAEALETLAEDK